MLTEKLFMKWKDVGGGETNSPHKSLMVKMVNLTCFFSTIKNLLTFLEKVGVVTYQ